MTTTPPPSLRWGSQWLRTVETARSIPSDALERGRSYGGYDWQLDVDVEPGIASATARSGPRITYRATVEVPVLSDAAWQTVIELVASSNDRTAALHEGDLDDALLRDSEAAGVPLLPSPNELTLSCECRSIDRPCKHAAAVVHLLADAIDEDPFDLLHLRGLDRTALVAAVTNARRDALEEGVEGEQPVDEDNDTAESLGDAEADEDKAEADTLRTIGLAIGQPRAPLPPRLPIPDTPRFMPPFPSDPPETALFTADGLRILGTDAAHRAHALLSGSDSGDLDLDPTTDLARRASIVADTDLWRGLVERSGLSSQELSARAAAWDRAGDAGLEAHVAAVETRRAEDGRQWRRTRQNEWFCFELTGGRYVLISGPHDHGPDLVD